MRRLKIFILIFVFFLSVAVVFAQNNRKIPKGMEAIRIGGSGELIVPKGAYTKKVGAQIIVEGIREYMSRRFEETEERFAQVEENQELLRQEIETLKSMINTNSEPTETDININKL